MSNQVIVKLKKEGNLRDYFFTSPKIGFEHYPNNEIQLVINGEVAMVFHDSDEPYVAFESFFDVSGIAEKIVAINTLMKTLSKMKSSDSILRIEFIWNEYEISWYFQNGFLRKFIVVASGEFDNKTPTVYLRKKDTTESRHVLFTNGAIAPGLDATLSEIIIVDVNTLSDRSLVNTSLENLHQDLLMPLFRTEDRDTLETMFTYFEYDVVLHNGTGNMFDEPERRFAPNVYVKLNMDIPTFRDLMNRTQSKTGSRIQGINLLFKNISIVYNNDVVITAKVVNRFGLLNLLKLNEWLNAPSESGLYAEEVIFEFDNDFGTTKLSFPRIHDTHPFVIEHKSWALTSRASYWVFGAKTALMKEQDIKSPEWKIVGDFDGENTTIVKLDVPDFGEYLYPLDFKYCFKATGKDVSLFFIIIELILTAFGYDKYGFTQIDYAF